MPVFLQRMQQATRLISNNKIPSYLLTHPVTAERVADIANRVQNLPYKQVESSLSFYLVRAKIQSMQGSSRDAVAFFTSAVNEHKGNLTAQRYGLVLSLLRNSQPQQAAQEFAPLKNLVTSNPMIATDAGQIQRQTNADSKDLSAFYRIAMQNFPQHRALIYDYADLLIASNRFEDALKLLNEQLIIYPDDADLYERQAHAYAGLGNAQNEHHALSHAYALIGALDEAINQLELAKRAGSDFYQLSAIESELKQYKEIVKARKDQQRQQR
jgi:predicted Zn-dependent protease